MEERLKFQFHTWVFRRWSVWSWVKDGSCLLEVKIENNTLHHDDGLIIVNNNNNNNNNNKVI